MPVDLTRRVEDLRDVLALRAFRLFSIGNFSSLVAIWIIRMCVGWMTWELTQSKSWLGLMAFAELGPSVIVSFFAGPLADTNQRWKVLSFGQGFQALLGVLLTLLVVFKLHTVWWLFTIMVGYSIFGGLNLPARMSIAPSLVPREKLATAGAVGSLSLNLSRLLGPLIAAPLLIAELEGMALALATVGFAINSFCVGSVRSTDLTGTPGAETVPGTGGYGEVVRDLAADPAVRTVLLIQFAVSLCVRPITDMFPAFADLVFQRGEGGYGALSAAIGTGAIIGALAIVGGSDDRTTRRSIVVGSVLFAISAILFALTRNFWIALAVLAFNGAVLTTSSVSATTFVQSNVPTERLGRVMSIYSFIFRFAPAVGALAMGALADAVGLHLAVAGVASVGLVAVLLLKSGLFSHP